MKIMVTDLAVNQNY